MPVNATFLVDVSAGLVFDDNSDKTWVHALPIGSYKHPIYGTVDVTVDRAKRFADNVKNKIRGTVEPSINYVHNNNDVAAGWVKDADNRSDGLWLLVDWVKDAAQAIKDKKWRYFSSEFVDEWEDANGVKHKDVILGGALTNRPFMKNLVPINLSEATVDNAFELVSVVSGTSVEDLKGGNGMELSEDALKKIIDGVASKLAPQKPPVDEPTGPKLTDIPELKQLAEENPMVALLIKQVEKQQNDIVEGAVALKEKDIATRLADFDRSKIILTPVARELVKDLAMNLSEEHVDDFWKLLSEMKKGSSFLVELGERTGATVNYGSQKSAVKQFDELATKLKVEGNLSQTDAYEAAAAQDRALFARYRQELMNGSGVTN